MFRSVLGVLFGIAVGALAISLIQRLGHSIYPVAPGIDLEDPAQFKTLSAHIPLGAKFWVIGSWFVGAVTASIGALLVARLWAPVAWIAVATLAAMAGMTMLEIPHPWWMVLAAPAAFFLGAFLPIKVLRANYQPPIPPDTGPF